MTSTVIHECDTEKHTPRLGREAALEDAFKSAFKLVQSGYGQAYTF